MVVRRAQNYFIDLRLIRLLLRTQSLSYRKLRPGRPQFALRYYSTFSKTR